MSVPIGAGFHCFSLGMAPFTGLEDQTISVDKNNILDEVKQSFNHGAEQVTVENKQSEVIGYSRA